MSVNPPAANNQGVPSQEEIKKAEAEKAKAEAEQARKEKESKEAQERTAKDAAQKKKELAAARKADDNVTPEESHQARTVGWEKEQVRREKEAENAKTEQPRVEKFNGHKLEDRLSGQPESEVADTEEEAARKASNK